MPKNEELVIGLTLDSKDLESDLDLLSRRLENLNDKLGLSVKNSLGDNLSLGLESGLDGVQDSWLSFSDNLGRSASSSLAEALPAAFTDGMDGLEAIWNNLWDSMLGSAMQGLKSLFGTGLESLLSPAVSWLGETVFSPLLDLAGDWSGEVLGGVWEAISGASAAAGSLAAVGSLGEVSASLAAGSGAALSGSLSAGAAGSSAGAALLEEGALGGWLSSTAGSTLLGAAGLVLGSEVLMNQLGGVGPISAMGQIGELVFGSGEIDPYTPDDARALIDSEVLTMQRTSQALREALQNSGQWARDAAISSRMALAESGEELGSWAELAGYSAQQAGEMAQAVGGDLAGAMARASAELDMMMTRGLGLLSGNGWGQSVDQLRGLFQQVGEAAGASAESIEAFFGQALEEGSAVAATEALEAMAEGAIALELFARDMGAGLRSAAEGAGLLGEKAQAFAVQAEPMIQAFLRGGTSAEQLEKQLAPLAMSLGAGGSAALEVADDLVALVAGQGEVVTSSQRMAEVARQANTWLLGMAGSSSSAAGGLEQLNSGMTWLALTAGSAADTLESAMGRQLESLAAQLEAAASASDLLGRSLAETSGVDAISLETGSAVPTSGGASTSVLDSLAALQSWGSGVGRMHSGGLVSGLSAGEVPIVALSGEFMMRRESVNAATLPLLRTLNQGAPLLQSQAQPVSVTVQISGNNFLAEDDMEDLARRLENKLSRLQSLRFST